ncbi:phospholipase [Mycobacterium alsense]|uniref:Phospholipase n=1 Tax=Mycobacterium alsense TaxID=324058 RepID=A0ABD6P4B2_9MYCO|nr:phospholipase D-like domain-containing protein [Mycobacterium alsense]OBG37972.1 phospholipase [Mycobacterium alsense]
MLITEQTCWRVERADQLACVVDAADYFRHVKAAMLRAEHRIMLVGWDFDTRTTFERGGKKLPGPNQLGPFLYWLLWQRPTLEIYVLKSNLRLLPVFDGIWYGITPVSVMNRLSSRRLRFAIDGARPTGSVHHQKLAIVDDVFAFCGGIDLTLDRWDTPEHQHDNRFRRALGRRYGPRHEVAAAVDGAAAAALAQGTRDRWRSATGRSLGPIDGADAVWPPELRPILHDVDVGIARTLPGFDGRREVREVEALNLAAISAARHTIYLENQYLAARQVVEALAARLREPDGPEIVIVLPRRGLNRLERETMDGARHRLIHQLWAADEHRRLGVYWAETDGGSQIYIHSKVLVVDDRLLRIGSSNFNNRSMGFDSECDLAVEADPNDGAHDHIRRAIASVRQRLVCEHLGVSIDEFAQAMHDGGSFLGAVEALRGEGKTLRRFTSRAVAGEDSALAENDLMDPDHVPRSLARSARRLLTRLSQ